MENQALRYRINVKSMAFDGAGHDSTVQKVSFHVEPLDSGSPFDYSDVLVQGDVLRCCILLREQRYVVVQRILPASDELRSWQEDLINAALKQAAANAGFHYSIDKIL